MGLEAEIQVPILIDWKSFGFDQNWYFPSRERYLPFAHQGFFLPWKIPIIFVDVSHQKLHLEMAVISY